MFTSGSLRYSDVFFNIFDWSQWNVKKKIGKEQGNSYEKMNRFLDERHTEV